ncbi:hypothetical protein BJY04DRAFT_213673 [Aspergillus karnatakaensis]|uniref:Zn(II)2Cys6 transcription factor n=1 Tax=Aspergillus karnatakaensis TaxID=1810916 RepID=UPI003CCD2827
MPDVHSGADAASNSSLLSRACDRCRQRKIRCDRTFPCAGCRSSGGTCLTTRDLAKQKRRRVLISSEYEEKIDRIEERLGRVLALAEELPGFRATPSLPLDHRGSSTMGESTPERSDADSQRWNSKATPTAVGVTDEVTVEGQTSMTAHSSFAIDFVHRLVGSGEGTSANHEIGELLCTLRQIGDAFTNRLPSSTLVRPSTPAGRELPPLNAAVQILQRAQEGMDFFFSCISWLLSPRSLSDLCLKVYFSPHSDAEFIILNLVLFNMATEIGQPGGARSEDHRTVVSLCQTNIELSLSQLPLCVDASYDMIFALLLSELLDSQANVQELCKQWLQSTADERVRDQIAFASAADEVQYLTLLTLIHRAMPRRDGAAATFSTDCITTARSALESHQAVVYELSTKASSFVLSAYVNWTILFTPFVPFIVLFCHSIETGDEKDLAQMHDFVNSIESTCQHSAAIAKHHRLFQVFYGVAVKYNELKKASTPSQDEYAHIRNEVDAQLSALGLQIQPSHGYDLSGSAQAGIPGSGYSGVDASGQPQGITGSGQGQGQQAASLEGWVSFNHHVMGLLDYNDLPF